MDGVGGDLNAFTDKETTCYYAKVIDRHIPLALDVLADMFVHSIFDPQELSKEQKVVLEEIKMYEDSPDDLIHDVFLQTMWRGSSLGEPTIGFADTVVRITPDDLRAHMRAHYAPNSVVVAAAGNVEHERFVELVSEQFSDVRRSLRRCRNRSGRRRLPRRTSGTKTASRRTLSSERAASTSATSAVTRSPYSIRCWAAACRAGFFKRFARSAASSIASIRSRPPIAPPDSSASTPEPRRATCSRASTSSSNSSRAIRNAPIDEREFQLAKEHIKGNLTLSLESTSSRMIRLGRNEFAFGRNVTAEEIERRIDAVTAADVQELASELLVDENLGLCIIGPVDEGAIVWSSHAA